MCPVYTDKKTKRLFIKFGFCGETYKKRLPARFTKRKAIELETKWKHQLFFESNGLEEKKQILFEVFLTEYYLPYADANHSKSVFEKDVYICKAALLFLKGKTLKQIKPVDIEKFKLYRKNLPTMHGKPRKASTIVRELSVLSKIFSLAVANDLLDVNPCSRVEKPKFDNIQDKVLALTDEPAFFAAFESDWAKDICLFVLHTGLRQNDVLGLSKFHVDLQNKTLRLVQGKTQRRVEIYLNDVAMEIISRRWASNSNLIFPSPKTGKQGSSVKTAIINACRRAGIGKLTIRDLRRTFATRLDELGFEASTIAGMLGHGDLRSVHRYQRAKEIRREAANSLVTRATVVPLRTAKG